MEKSQQKIWFLQFSRVIACFLVVYTHWYGLLSTPNVIAGLILQDPLPHYVNPQLMEFMGVMTHFLGIKHFYNVYFGLGLFFILSGYVIPLSLKNSTPFSYLTRRIFRIYPSVIVCLLIATTTMIFVSEYLGSTNPRDILSFRSVIGNFSLLSDLFFVHKIESVTWTLEIEMHFYILFFLFFYYNIEKRITTFLATASVMLILSKAIALVSLSYPWAIIIEKGITINTSYITFMFVGTTIYYTLSKQWSYMQGLFTLIALLIINYFCLNLCSINKGTADFIFLNHLYVLVFFLFLYFANNYIPYSKFLNKIADISYPLYLIHGATGYSFYFMFYRATENIALSAFAALSIVFALATLVHHQIEKPGIELSKNLLRTGALYNFLFRKRSTLDEAV